MDAATFRDLGHRLVDKLAELMESLPERAVTRDVAPSAIRSAFGLTDPLPARGTDPRELIERTADQLFTYSLFNAHPRFFGYITAPPAPIGIHPSASVAIASNSFGPAAPPSSTFGPPACTGFGYDQLGGSS